MSVYEYRLTWESIGGPEAAAIEHDRGGKNCWPTVDFSTLDWHESSRVALDGSDIHGQFATLVRWAETHEQPIRNVRLERRWYRPDDDGWEPIAQNREVEW